MSNVFIEMVRRGTIRNQDELKREYKRLVKALHPDTAVGVARSVDMDTLKQHYEAAAIFMAGGKNSTATQGFTDGFGDRTFRFGVKEFMNEFRDLLARGLPLRNKALEKNKAYRESAAYIDASFVKIFGGTLRLQDFDRELRLVMRRAPKVYSFVLNAMWNQFDYFNTGYKVLNEIARRYARSAEPALREAQCANVIRVLRYLVEQEV